MLFRLALTLSFACGSLANIVKAPKLQNEGISPRVSGHVHLHAATAGGYELELHIDEEEILGNIGRTITNVDEAVETTEDGVTFVDFGNDVNLTYSTEDIEGGFKVSVSWKAPRDHRLEDCFDLGTKNWYGGPQQEAQHWPIEKLTLVEYSNVPKELDNAAIAEPYFLNSAGQYIYLHPQVPLFLDENNILANHICFIAKVDSPYSSSRLYNELTYDFIEMSDVKAAHQHAVDTYLGKPSGIPDYRMIQHPIWSSWARYSRPINQSIMDSFSKEILQHGFNNSQFEIDDLWEVCYGSLTVNEDNFPDMAGFVQQLKDDGFRVTLWIHPFINADCDPWYTEALDNGYLVRNEEGSVETSWWNDNGTTATYVDFTNPEAAAWWSDRLKALKERYGFDSFKFDAGETSWTPQVSVLNVDDIHLHPSQIVQDYVRTCAEFGDMIEVRSGARTQDLPVFVRVVDKDSLWTFENGLPTLITTLLEMNLNGYTLVLPDMIGGNGYDDIKPSKELFIRWLQANTFMPALQFSFVPFDFDDETIEISHKFTDLHAEYADEVVKAMEASVSDGTPVNAPLWWIAPNDSEVFDIWDQYLLGENILVAPVVEEGAVSRNIYLPAGTWYAEGDTERVYEGGQWLEDYPAPLDTLPYFVRDPVSGSAALISGVILTAFLSIFALLQGLV